VAVEKMSRRDVRRARDAEKKQLNDEKALGKKTTETPKKQTAPGASSSRNAGEADPEPSAAPPTPAPPSRFDVPLAGRAFILAFRMCVYAAALALAFVAAVWLDTRYPGVWPPVWKLRTSDAFAFARGGLGDLEEILSAAAGGAAREDDATGGGVLRGGGQGGARDDGEGVVRGDLGCESGETSE
jgi:hypothetical protein